MGEDRGKRLTLEERRIDELTSAQCLRTFANPGNPNSPINGACCRMTPAGRQLNSKSLLQRLGLL